MRESPSLARDFATKFANALARRLYPNSTLRPKELAYAAGYSRDAFTAWLRGTARVPGEAIYSLGRFFKDRGDGWFLVELFGDQSEAEAMRMEAELVELEHRLAALRAKVEGNGHVALVTARGGVGDVAKAAAPGAPRRGPQVDGALEAASVAAPLSEGSR